MKYYRTYFTKSFEESPVVVKQEAKEVVESPIEAQETAPEEVVISSESATEEVSDVVVEEVELTKEAELVQAEPITDSLEESETEVKVASKPKSKKKAGEQKNG